MWANRSICSYSDFNLVYVAEFQYKTGYATAKKTVGMETLNTHVLLTVYICTKEHSNIVFTSQSHKVAYFYDVGRTYAIDHKINHLHNDREANMWGNNVPSVCDRGYHRKEKKTELNVVLNESLNTINKGNGNKVSSVGIFFFHVEAA